MVKERLEFEQYQTKEPSALHERFAEWITAVTGIEADVKTVQAAVALRIPFQKSDFNIAGREAERAAAPEKKAPIKGPVAKKVVARKGPGPVRKVAEEEPAEGEDDEEAEEAPAAPVTRKRAATKAPAKTPVKKAPPARAAKAATPKAPAAKATAPVKRSGPVRRAATKSTAPEEVEETF